MDLTIVGSGTAAPDGERVSAAVHIGAGPVSLLLDCGSGAVHRMAGLGIEWDRLTHVALTHFHTDHVGDLPMLLFALKYAIPAPRREPLTVLTPPGGRQWFDRLAAAFGEYIRNPGFELDVRELAPGESLELEGALRIATRKTPHTAESIAYRVDAVGWSAGYTGDTGEDPGQAAFFQGVDVLVAECSLPDELAIDMHLTPSRVAALARGAQPGHLIVSHIYPQLEGRDVAGLVRAAGWEGRTTVARDGLRIPL